MVDATEVQAHFLEALKVMAKHVSTMDQDPGKALMHLTWLGIAMANQAQEQTVGVESAVQGEDAEMRFLSMPGMLTNSYGKLISIERESFPHVMYGGSRDSWGPA